MSPETDFFFLQEPLCRFYIYVCCWEDISIIGEPHEQRLPRLPFALLVVDVVLLPGFLV